MLRFFGTMCQAALYAPPLLAMCRGGVWNALDGGPCTISGIIGEEPHPPELALRFTVPPTKTNQWRQTALQFIFIRVTNLVVIHDIPASLYPQSQLRGQQMQCPDSFRNLVV